MFGRIADRLGRKKIYGYEVLVLAIGAIASAFAPSIWWLIGFRAVLGFGIGGDYPVSATIMSEYASKDNRGKMVALVKAGGQGHRDAGRPGQRPAPALADRAARWPGCSSTSSTTATRSRARSS